MNKHLITFASTLAICCGGQAAVVNISTTQANNLVNFTDQPGIYGTGATLSLGPGSYVVTPVDTSFSGALYTAALRFSSADPPNQGWEWNYWLKIDNGPGTKFGFGEYIPAQGSNSYQANAPAAFALAPAPHTFTLAASSKVTLYWRDDVWADNSGGISVDVSPVPEPGGYALAFAGLGVVGMLGARRRRTC